MAAKKKSRPAPWLYLFGVLAWTWIGLAPAVFSTRGLLEFPVVIFSIIGLLGPIIVPALLIASGRWDESLDPTVGHFFRRCFDPRGLSALWYLWVVGLVAILVVTPVLLEPDTRVGGGIVDAGPGLFLIIGALGALEEPGWRGYAQEGLQRRMPVLLAGLIIGVFWATWHLPLFFIEGTYQAGLGVGSPAFWAFHLAIVVGAPFYAWLYNAAGRVIFVAVLYHGLSNMGRELTPDASVLAEVGVEAAMTLVVVVVAWRWMRRPVPQGQTKQP